METLVLKQRLTEVIFEEEQKLKGFVKKRLGSLPDVDAEDVIYEVVTRIFEREEDLTVIEHLGAFLYKSLRNLMIDWRKKKRADVSLNVKKEETDQSDMIAMVIDYQNDTQGDFERKELRKAIFDAVDKLPLKLKAVWVATEIEGHKFKDLATLWNEPVGTLLSRKHKANQLLQVQLKEYLT